MHAIHASHPLHTIQQMHNKPRQIISENDFVFFHFYFLAIVFDLLWSKVVITSTDSLLLNVVCEHGPEAMWQQRMKYDSKSNI